MKLADLLLALGNVDPRAVRKHAGIAFDPVNGLGASGDTANSAYRGFQTYMTPRQFLEANPPRNTPYDYVRDAIVSGEPVGTPIVYADRLDDGRWKVRGHEGRGRMSVLHDMSPDSLFPVAVQPTGWVRARHLDGDSVLRSLLPDDMGGVSQVSPRMSSWNGGLYVAPSSQEDEAVLRAIRELLPVAE